MYLFRGLTLGVTNPTRHAFSLRESRMVANKNRQTLADRNVPLEQQSSCRRTGCMHVKATLLATLNNH